MGAKKWKVIRVLLLWNMNKCLYQNSRQSIQQLLRYFSWTRLTNKVTQLSSSPSSHTASLSNKNWQFNNEPNMQQSLCHTEMVKLLAKRSERKRWWQRRNTPPAERARQLRWSQAWTLSVTWTCHGFANEQVWSSNSNFDFSYNTVTLQLSRTSRSLQSLLPVLPSNMDRNSGPWQGIQQYVD